LAIGVIAKDIELSGLGLPFFIVLLLGGLADQ
jgi:hypothetical protein